MNEQIGDTLKMCASSAEVGTWKCLFCGREYPAATVHMCPQSEFAKNKADISNPYISLESFRAQCLYAAITGLCVTHSTRAENASKMPRWAPRIVDGIICQANEVADAAVAFEDQRRRIVAGMFTKPLDSHADFWKKAQTLPENYVMKDSNPENGGAKLKPSI